MEFLFVSLVLCFAIPHYSSSSSISQFDNAVLPCRGTLSASDFREAIEEHDVDNAVKMCLCAQRTNALSICDRWEGRVDQWRIPENRQKLPKICTEYLGQICPEPTTTTTTPTPTTTSTTMPPPTTAACLQGVSCYDPAVIVDAGGSDTCSCDNECSNEFFSCCLGKNGSKMCFYKSP